MWRACLISSSENKFNKYFSPILIKLVTNTLELIKKFWNWNFEITRNWFDRGKNNSIFYSILRDIVAECSTRDSMWCYIKHRDGTGLSTLRSVSPLRMGCMHNSRFRVVEGKRRRRKKRKHFDHGKTTGVDFQLSWKRYLKAFESRIPLTRPSLERSRISSFSTYLVKIVKKKRKKEKTIAIT